MHVAVRVEENTCSSNYAGWDGSVRTRRTCTEESTVWPTSKSPSIIWVPGWSPQVKTEKKTTEFGRMNTTMVGLFSTESRQIRNEQAYIHSTDGSYIFSHGAGSTENTYTGLIFGHHLDPVVPMPPMQPIHRGSREELDNTLVLVKLDGAALLRLKIQVLEITNPALQY